MDHAALLRRIRTLADLRTVVATVGHTSTWVEIPPDALPVEVDAAACCGHAGAFEWLAVRTATPEETAPRLSLALAARGRRTGVLALDERRRLLAIAATAGRTVVTTIALDAPEPGDLERLRHLRAAGGTAGFAFALRAVEALEVEDAGRRFFLAFRDQLAEMAARIAPGAPLEERRTLALVQLTRVLFLYFVQAKGWLDGRPDFLRTSVDTHLGRGRRLHSDLFRPLFFGTLNCRAAERGRARAFGRIPFLNGGLFEPHALERRWRPDVDNDTWRDTFDRLFERFHFVVREGAGPGQIAPDMLGRVFERLMAPDDRRATGAYYTPATLVRRLVDAALDALVATRFDLTTRDASHLLASRHPRVLAFLRDVTILDPATGSGAFLTGALERLAELRHDEAPPAELRRRILESNLYGVDLNPMAVRLAELRLWLAVIAADETTDPEAVRPLPNLDGVVRQGDSLLEPSRLLGRLGVHAGAAGADLRELRGAFVTASGPEKADLLRRLRRAETRTLATCLATAETRLERGIVECLTAARTPTLFGEPRGLDAELRRTLAELRRQMGEVRSLARRLRREGEVPWFAYECHFGDVLARGGFDLVVGNPPWVRAEQLPPRMRAQLAGRYRWWRGSGPGFAHQPDLALAFTERATELLTPGGVLAFVLPAKIATAGYARAMRADLAERFTLHAVADLREAHGAVFEALAYPAALVLSRGAPAQPHAVRLSLDPTRPGTWPQERLTGGGPWALASPDLLTAIADVRDGHPTLGERFMPQLGVKTGANAAFLDPPPALEASLVRRALRGRDVLAFRSRDGVRLFFPHDAAGEPYVRLPPVAARHARCHDALLRTRVDYRSGPPWTLFRVRGTLAPYRVVWADLARQLTALALVELDQQRLVPLNTCYLLATSDRDTALAVTAWLNCTWIREVARAAADMAASGFARFNARVIRDLPLPPEVLRDPHLVRLAVRGARGESIQEELDERCAHILALSGDSRAVLARAAALRAADRGGSADRGTRSA